MYTYRARVIDVIDGDTLRLEVDLGLDVHLNITGRLAYINAPEKRTPEGKAAMAWLSLLVTPDHQTPWLRVETIKDRREKYGRYLVVLWPYGDYAQSINTRMVEQGHAVPYPAGAKIREVKKYED